MRQANIGDENGGNLGPHNSREGKGAAAEWVRE